MLWDGVVVLCYAVCVHVYVYYDVQELSYVCRVLSLSLNLSLMLKLIIGLFIYYIFLYVLCVDCLYHFNMSFLISFIFIPFLFLLPFPPTVMDFWVWALRSAWTRQQ